MMVPAAPPPKAVGKPVKVIYSRENDMTMDFSRPLTYQKIAAGLDDNGNIVAMTTIWSAPGRPSVGAFPPS